MLPLVATFFLRIMRYFKFFQFLIFLVLSSVVVSLPSCKKTVMGCADPLACNYSDDVTEDNGSCTYSTEIYDCDGNCIDDVDEDGICDQQESFGCGDVTACNYSSEVTESVDSLCVYAQEFYNCDGDCINDEDQDGVCDELEIDGCTNQNAFNYDPSATNDDHSCLFSYEIMATTWNVLSQCDGMFIGTIIPDEITITSGANDGDLLLDLGNGFIVNGSINKDGSILIPSQEIDITITTVTVSGNGQLESEDNSIIYINFSSLFINDNCVLTLTN